MPTLWKGLPGQTLIQINLRRNCKIYRVISLFTKFAQDQCLLLRIAPEHTRVVNILGCKGQLLRRGSIH